MKRAKWSRWPGLRQCLLASTRVAFLLGALLLMMGALGYRTAHARMAEELSGFGRQLVAWHGARPHSAARRLFLNGAHVEVLSLSMARDLTATLDEFEQECRGVGGVRAPGRTLEELGLRPDFMLRKEGAGEGVLACLDTGGPLTPEEVLQRVERFTKAGDLSEVGQLRYVFARSSGPGRTEVLALWTEGALPLKKMFVGAGDRPGRDPVDVPRMPGLRRLLSASESGEPYSVSIYEAEPGGEPLGWYARALSQAGWKVAKTPNPRVLRATYGGRTLLIRLSPRESTLSLVELS